ncbi:TatD-related deoxyribonuclease [Methanolinea mesophila]|uniref:TatD family hydrolase n=1 Tax=Methanolinea mesophila TaxID=547055 RepID=UPI001AE24118|nr:TatD family hydrolase [Methanolinea mesophila]MBP1928056.1 TatD-related deoxyribonuclease [Methanolinea mesophila]
MKIPSFPVTDDHIHIDPVNGRGLEAAKDFLRAGGSHLFLVCKPTSSFGITPAKGTDFTGVFDETLAIAEQVRELGLTVGVVLGVHPAEITRLSGSYPLSRVEEIMKEGISLAATYVADGRAVALKSGRPHYEVPGEILDASNRVLAHAFSCAARNDCAIQVHAESGPCADMVPMAESAGLPSWKVVKHYATPDTPLTPSFIATHPDIPELCREKREFTMESDYMDENSRPGAVIGPKSVPRATFRLLEQGIIEEEDAFRIHAETPAKVYGMEISR